MKPLRVVMQAFGPYPARQEVDFRVLGDQTLFLISGPTGSGKTSVLDAMCFALYGEATGAERPTDRLRSDHASVEVPTEVVLDFELKGEPYRIERRPAQERPKQRGEGTTLAPATATLYRRTGLDDDATEGEVLADGVRDVGRQIGELIPFDVGQFRQVVVLPQGEFRKLLESDSTSREQILARLFETARYRQLTDALKRRFKALQVRLARAREQRGALLEQVECDEVPALEQRIESEAEGVEVLDGQRGQAEVVAREASAALEKGKEDAKKLQEVATAVGAHAGLEAERQAMDERGRELDAARRAATLDDVVKLREQRKGEVDDASRALDKARERLQKAAESRGQAQAALEAVEQERPAREQAVAEVGRYEAMASAVEALDRAREAVTGAEARAKELEREVGEAKKKLATASASRDAARAAFETARDVAAGLTAAAGRVKELEAVVALRRKLDHAIAAVVAAEASRQRAAEADEQAAARLGESLDALDALETAWREGQAAALAASLHDGEPCPVCGSEHHPAPAHAGVEVPGEQALEAARSAVEAARGEHRATQERLSGAATALKVAEGQRDERRELLGDRAGEEPQALADQLTEARSARDAAAKASDGLASLQEAHAAAEAAHTRAEEAVQEANEALQGHRADLAGLKGTLQERERAVPEALRVPGALQAALQAARKVVADFDAAHAARTGELGEAQTLVATWKGKEEALVRGLADATEHLADAEKEVALRIGEAGFDGMAAFLAARREREDIEALDGAIRGWKESLAAASDRLERARAAAQELEPPELDVLQAAAETARAAHGALQEQLGSAREAVKNLKDVRDRIAAIDAAHAADSDRYSCLGHLADVADGRNPQRLTFERFVLATMLDQVLLAANQRLGVMSSGRYQLQRAEETRDKRRKGGLDLEVFDAYTGHARPVATLSGGEGFEASLALALGLADTVQSSTGGVQLDAVFVDEGFGSLGQEDLDAVIAALQDLQDGGRLVGLISHVAELRERIPTRLEIDKGRTGSTARFVLP